MTAAWAPQPQQPDDRAPSPGQVPLRLPVLGATASGPTGLAAFHRALVSLGLGHYNLVRLSSVIPPATRVGAGRPGRGPAHARWEGRRPRTFVDGRRGDGRGRR